MSLRALSCMSGVTANGKSPSLSPEQAVQKKDPVRPPRSNWGTSESGPMGYLVLAMLSVCDCRLPGQENKVKEKDQRERE